MRWEHLHIGTNGGLCGEVLRAGGDFTHPMILEWALRNSSKPSCSLHGS